MNEKIVSYILVKREPPGSVAYWRTAQANRLTGWVPDLTEARRFAKRSSAGLARQRLLKRPGMNPDTFLIEMIAE